MTNSITRRQALGLLAGTTLLPGTALADGLDGISGRAFGTDWQLIAPRDADLGAIAASITDLFSTIDGQFSPYRADSLVSQFNADTTRTAMQDTSIVRVTRAALDIARQSEGAFDPTVGPLVARWGFGPITQGGAPNWRGLTAGPKEVTKTGSDLTLDLCGIAKGWALDEAARIARDHGLRDFLFDIGGELLAQGVHPSGRDWRVAVEPETSDRLSPAILRLPSGSAVATSGIQAQSYRLQTKTYGHIIDPRSATPVQGRLRSVSVVAQDAMTADGWATALFAAGDEAGPEMADALGLAALFVFDGTKVRHSPAMAGFLT